MQACLAHIDSGPADIVFVALADLLGEVEQENLPGTTTEHPNWRRRQSLSLEEIADSPAAALLQLLRSTRVATH